MLEKNLTLDSIEVEIALVILIISMGLTVIPFFSVILYKEKKIKLDSLLYEKQLFKFLFESYLIFFIVFFALKNIHYLLAQIIIPIFFISKSLINFFICYERFFTLKDPFRVINSYLKKESSYLYYYELSFLLFISTSLTFGILYNNQDENFMNYVCYITSGIIALITISTSFLINLERKLILNVPQNSNEYIKNIIHSQWFENVTQYIFVLLISILQNFKFYEYQFSICLVYLILDDLFTMGEIYNSDYYYFVLAHTKIGFFYKLFGRKFSEKPMISKENSTSFINNEYSIQYLFDKGYYIESYVLKLCDDIIQSFFFSLFTAYNKYNNNYSYNKNSDLLDDSISKYDYNDVVDKEKLKKTEIGNDHSLIFKERDDLKIEVHFYFQNKFFEYIKIKKIDIASIKKSLISNLHNESSIIVKNIKEDFLDNGLVIKTFDKQCTLELLDDDFFKKKSKVMKNYLKHILKSKHSFLPIILGAFTMKINELKPLNFIFYKTRFINEIPREQFNSWQIIRVNKNDEELLKTSVTKSKYDYINKNEKENIFNSNEKFVMNNYLQFKDNLSNDFRFLKKNKMLNFSLLTIIYEIGNLNNQNTSILEENEKQGKSIQYNNRISFGSKNNLSQIKAIKMNFNNKTKSQDSFFNNNTNNNALNQNSFLFDNTNFKSDLSNILYDEGYDGDFNNFKHVLFYSFDNCFREFQILSNKNYYKEYFLKIMDKFEAVSFEKKEKQENKIKVKN